MAKRKNKQEQSMITANRTSLVAIMAILCSRATDVKIRARNEDLIVTFSGIDAEMREKANEVMNVIEQMGEN